MLQKEKVFEVKRLLDEGAMSRRAIADRTGVSRGSVNSIANGDRGLHGAEPEDVIEFPFRSTVAKRCLGCGGLVYMPCVLCQARVHQSRDEPADNEPGELTRAA